jgi:hypothetical protein
VKKEKLEHEYYTHEDPEYPKLFFTFSLDEKKAMEFLDRHLLHLVNHKYRKAIFLPYFVVVVVVAKIVVSQQFLSATLSQIISPRFLSFSI